jgi:hypothetical protein
MIVFNEICQISDIFKRSVWHALLLRKKTDKHIDTCQLTLEFNQLSISFSFHIDKIRFIHELSKQSFLPGKEYAYMCDRQLTHFVEFGVMI